jgi:hypothetical protein
VFKVIKGFLKFIFLIIRKSFTSLIYTSGIYYIIYIYFNLEDEILSYLPDSLKNTGYHFAIFFIIVFIIKCLSKLTIIPKESLKIKLNGKK